MTNQEFSDAFDVLYNNLNSNQAPALNIYEKSLFLTQAQESIVVSLYNSLETTEEIRKELSSLIKTKVYGVSQVAESDDNTDVLTLPTGFKLYSVNDFNRKEILFSIYEQAKFQDDSNKCINNKVVVVRPVKHDMLYATLRNPFKSPNKYKVLRLDTEDNVQLISSFDLSKYTVRYLKRPTPIVLGDLEEDEYFGINSVKTNTECELDPILHQLILQEAVNRAKAAYVNKS